MSVTDTRRIEVAVLLTRTLPLFETAATAGDWQRRILSATMRHCSADEIREAFAVLVRLCRAVEQGSGRWSSLPENVQELMR